MKRLKELITFDKVQREHVISVIQKNYRKIPEKTPYYILACLFFVVIAGFSIWAFSQIPEGSASLEVVNTTNAQTIENIINNPLYLPHKVASFILLQFTDSVRSLRAVSIIIFMLCGAALYSLLKRWHSSRVATLTLILFSTNATVLAISRLADPQVMLFSWSILLSLLLWVMHSRSKHVAPISLAIAGLMVMYIPGALYVFLILFVLFMNRIKDFIKSISLRSGIIASILFLIAIAPLAFASLRDWSVLRAWLLLPESIIYSDIPANILAVPSSYFYRFQITDPLIAVGRLPILDIASGSLLLLGSYSYYKNRVLERTKIMFLGGLVAIMLGALGQTRLGVALFMPFAFMLMAGGISYLLDIWFNVFPRNPLARVFAFVVIALVIFASSVYQLKKFFVVWPNTPETSEVYNQPRLIQ